MDTVINLITETIGTDDIGNQTVTETSKQVFATAKPITQNEFFSARTTGINPAVKMLVFFGDYAGEELLEWNGQKYNIYRTYLREDDIIELYAERHIGQQ